MMMKLSTFKYHLGQGVRSLFKNGFMSLAAIATVVACSFILILSLCICMNLDYILKQIEETIGITVFLGPNVTEDMAEDIGEQIKAIDHVTQVEYKSAEENLDEAMDSWENKTILEGLSEDNPFPASFDIKLDGVNYQDEVVKALETLQLSVEAELNSNIDPDSVEKIYLDANGNRISEKQAASMGLVETTTSAAAEQQSAAAAPAEASTEVVTAGAQTDVKKEAETSGAEATTVAPAADDSAAQAEEANTAAQTAEQQPATEATEEETEPVTYSSAPSAALIATLNEAVAATAGGKAQLSTSYSYNQNSPEGVAGINKYDASKYGINEYEYKGIEKIRHASELAHALVRINTAVRIFSIIIVVILCIISISIIMNTIRLTVVIRKNEINIMKYVGATDWFIRWPFIIEGMLIGFIGSLIPTILCFFGYTEGLHLMAEKIPVFGNIAQFMGPVEIFMRIAPITILFGIVLGIIGSVSSMRKYLRV